MFYMLSRFIRPLLEKVPYLAELLYVRTWLKNTYGTFTLHIIIGAFEKTFVVGKTPESHEFIFCAEATLPEEKYGPIKDAWKCLARSFGVMLWERVSPQNESSLRFGLNETDRIQALAIVRRTAQAFLLKEVQPSFDTLSLSSRFYEPATICAAIWINGAVRGSVIEKGETLFATLLQGGKKLCVDGRFKPVSHSELEESRIEITLASDLRLPLSSSSINQGTIDSHVGYLIEYGKKRGWYMPEMFNCTQFPSLKQLVTDLAYRKAGITSAELPYAAVSRFAVQDFIESSDRTRALAIDGTVPFKKNIVISNITSELLRETGLQSFGQLEKNQQSDGNIPPILDPLVEKRKRQIGWPQLACTTWAMALFARTIQDETLLQKVRLSFDYLSENILREKLLSHRTIIVTLPYLIRASDALERKEIHKKYSEALFENTGNLEFYDSIAYANIASVFAYVENSTKSYAQRSTDFALKTYADFIQKKKGGETMSLAQYPELALACDKIGHVLNEAAWFEKRDIILNWLCSFQMENGAFPRATQGPEMPYTRGTGKIFEVLSNYPKYATAAQKAFMWLTHMQYSKESLFFVKPDLHPLIEGGLRHDYLNHEVWIDGSAHLLIGISHLLSQQERGMLFCKNDS